MKAALAITALACLFFGAVSAWSIGSLFAEIRAARAQAVANSNLQRAERKFVACIESKPFTVGSAIYIPQTRESELTTASVPELLSEPPGAGGS